MSRRAFIVVVLTLSALAGCAGGPQSVSMLHPWCEVKTEGRLEGTAIIEGRAALAKPMIAIGRTRYVQRAIWHGVGGAATLMCSRSAAELNQCLLSAESEEGYGFGAWALSVVPDLDVPSRPEAPPVRVEFVFTLTEPRTSTCGDEFAK